MDQTLGGVRREIGLVLHRFLIRDAILQQMIRPCGQFFNVGGGVVNLRYLKINEKRAHINVGRAGDG